MRLFATRHFAIFLLFCTLGALAGPPGNAELNEFAEFEDDEVEIPKPPSQQEKPKVEEPVKEEKQQQQQQKPVTTDDDDDDDFGVVEETEENEQQTNQETPSQPEPLKFADVPAHFRSNWASYQVEAVVMLILALYLLNYIFGRATNQNLAYNWFAAHKAALEQQFAVVGDDGLSETPSEGNLTKDTDCSFSIWCSGRVGVSGLLIQMRTMKRQDLVSRVIGLFSPQTDKITFKFDFDQNEIDSWVLAVGQKKHVAKQHKELADLSTYASEKKSGSFQGLPASWGLFSELNEAALGVLDPGVLTLLRKYEQRIHSIHITDQFCGQKLAEGETYTRLPDVSRVAIFSFELRDGNDEVHEEDDELISLMFYLLDKARRFRLSREGKVKTEKNRQTVEESFLKTTHLQRQEAAQARREERTRERKQRLLEEEDPEKQRRLEKLEAKHDRKMKPKMKQLKIR
ncbi:unnamed protein product, partial [Mesorhabditis belari]|uniref:PAT complex subunit CCDC47 n=1 Tax=Mesorhabditis belari TaxID=2138241 RepID=A0AAF3ETE7_9BILA